MVLKLFEFGGKNINWNSVFLIMKPRGIKAPKLGGSLTATQKQKFIQVGGKLVPIQKVLADAKAQDERLKAWKAQHVKKP